MENQPCEHAKVLKLNCLRADAMRSGILKPD
jgi:hypothetical protein